MRGQAFAAIDFTGKGFVTQDQIADAKFVAKLKFSRDQVASALKSDVQLGKFDKIRFEVFAKYFFPEKQKVQEAEIDELSDDDVSV